MIYLVWIARANKKRQDSKNPTCDQLKKKIQLSQNVCNFLNWIILALLPYQKLVESPVQRSSCTKIIHLIKKGHFFFQFRSRIKVAKNLQFMFHPYETYDEEQIKNISEIQDNIPEKNTVSRIYVFTSYLKRWNQRQMVLTLISY